MADPYRNRESTGIPRWAKVSLIIAAVVALLVVVMMLIGGGEHGPRRHGASSDTSGRPAPLALSGPSVSYGTSYGTASAKSYET